MKIAFNITSILISENQEFINPFLIQRLMRVLLLNPPYEKDKIFRKSMKNLGAVLPPLGIAYIAAVLEKDNHTVKIIDGPACATVFGYDFKDLEKDIADFSPDVVGVS